MDDPERKLLLMDIAEMHSRAHLDVADQLLKHASSIAKAGGHGVAGQLSILESGHRMLANAYLSAAVPSKEPTNAS